MFVLRIFGGLSVGLYAILLFASGVAINGPYGLISGAVSNDLVCVKLYVPSSVMSIINIFQSFTKIYIVYLLG